jgi:micrococcal nuclease
MVTIQTSPNISCSITVIYKSGPSKAAGLEPKVSDSKGMVEWTWRVGTRTTPGEWPIAIECGQGNITRVRTSFEVT